jgi:hypothetical protein
MMKLTIKVFLLCIILLIWLSTAVGADNSGSAYDFSSSKIWLGNAKSRIEIFFVSDWYCPYCRKAEPAIEEMLPEVGKISRYTFADFPVHRESNGFVPYNISLLINEKKQYQRGRHALLSIAGKTRSPDDASIRVALAQKGIIFKMAGFSDIFQTTNRISMLLRGSGVKMTPSVLIRNTRTGKMIILEGMEEIQKPIVMATIKSLEG